MDKTERADEKHNREELFERFKTVEITPLPHFSVELMQFPDEVYSFLRKTAEEHNCTVSRVIEQCMEDLLSEPKDISEISPETLEQVAKEKPYVLVKREGKPFARISFFGDEKLELKND